MSEENKNINIEDGGAESPGMQSVSPLIGEPEPLKREKKISLSGFVFSAIALVLAAVMLTYVCCNTVYKRKLAEAKLTDVSVGRFSEYDELELLSALFKTYSYYGVDDEEIVEKVLKAYVEATGDPYAAYYTAEEYKALLADSAGENVGIGINIVSSLITKDGVEYDGIELIGVTPDSPADKAGLRVGDVIVWIGVENDRTAISEIGYDEATRRLVGAEGTKAEFIVLRRLEGGACEEIPFSVERQKVETLSVYYSVSEADNRVGIIKISSFDLNVPKQLCEAIDKLTEEGCVNFVFDLRYNLGGDLESIKAALSYFLDEGDRILSTVDREGNEEIILVQPMTHDSEAYVGCDISKEDIGKYACLKGRSVVLCNGATASAAELFTAALRDHSFATVVGKTTYGKGSMQRTFPLSNFGYTGAVKLTVRFYFPPCGEGYDGIGIIPDKEVDLSEEAKKYNHYLLPQSLDDQLIAALGYLK